MWLPGRSISRVFHSIGVSYPDVNSKRLDGQLASFASLLESEWGIRFGVTPKLKPVGGLPRRLREHRS